MYESPVGNAVRDSLRSIAMSGGAVPDDEVSALRARVCAAVDELKSLGWPVERIIIRIKEVASEVGLTRHLESGRPDLIDSAVRWCIDRYYGTH